MPAWTEEMDAVLKREAAAGSSAGQIAKMLGTVTRSAVCGRCVRMKIKLGNGKNRGGYRPGAGRPKSAPPPPPPKPAPSPKPVVAMVPKPKAPPAPPAPPKPKRPPLRPAEIVPIGITIDALTLRTCRAPLWGNVTPPTDEALYCGASTAVGCTYCAGHRWRFTARLVPPAKAKEAA